jgi:uncharacterized membrane protein
MAYRKRSSLIAGTVTGLRFAIKSFEPSLMPRSAIDQGLITGGSFLTGFLAGSSIGRATGAIPLLAASPMLRFAGLAVTGVRSAQTMRWRLAPGQTDHRPGGAWAEAGGEVIGGMTVAGLSTDSHAAVSSRAAFAAIGIASAMDLQAALTHRTDAPDARYVVTALGVAAGANAAVAALGGVVALGGSLPKRIVPSKRLATVAGFTGAMLTLAGLGTAGKVAASRLIASIESGNAQTEVAYSEPPPSSTVSGSEFSLVAFETLGLQGRRLVSEVTARETIDEVMGAPAKVEPVRVYVGMESASSDDDLIELTINELRRAGGFDRSTIIAASPAGTGYVNYITVEAAELMALGDVATVAIQFGGLPSMMSMSRVERAAALYGNLLARLREEIDLLDRGIRLVAYGESLGATISQMGVEAASGEKDLIVDAALWVGTPFGSSLFEKLTVHDNVPVFDRFEQYETQVDADRPPVTFLNHDNDPVTKFTPTIAYRMPAWLRTTDRGRGTNPYQRWLPGIAFWQGLIDTKNAATVVPGEFKSTGHDYRADLARFVRAAYGFSDVSDDQLGRIEERLRDSEIRRAEAIADGKIPAS